MIRANLGSSLRALVVLIGSAALGFSAEPNPMEILRKVDATILDVQEVQYEAKTFYEGVTAPPASGVVRAAKVGKDGEFHLRVEGRSGDRSFRVVTDGKEVLYVGNADEKVALRGKLPEAQALLGPGYTLFMQEYTHPTPYSDELHGDSVTYEGTREIGGVECHVVHVVYAKNQGKSRWYFGTKDSFPRRVDRFLPDGQGIRVLEVHALDTDPDFGPETFSVKAPEGFEEREFKAPQRQARPELLAVGSKAPGWTLKTPDGKDVSLENLRGKIVVLDFWATWCGPCRRAMPGLQKIHEKYERKPVAIIGVNCWERGDPAKYMKEAGLTYGLLVKGDDVATAYHVSGIPTFYVIGPDGAIVHRASGFSPGLEDALGEVIDKALKSMPQKRRRRL